ncbi:protein NLP4 [Arachis duranensis]|uniref:Protein NLP4 n=1 Tax=Arachis duranensis TaxID=130453 RepID=A0A6P4B0B6_ARADU|nr:protein NLP4 [Arachis duranensis]XP_015934089.1 protein NLP4 [Arachis duranensis]
MRDGGVLSSGTMLEPTPPPPPPPLPPPPAPPPTTTTSISVDYDYINELFVDGCWLAASSSAAAAADGSADFYVPSPSFSNPIFDPFSWPCLDTEQIESQAREREQEHEKQEQPPPFSHDLVVAANSCSRNQQQQYHHYENQSVENNNPNPNNPSEFFRRWWIAPSSNPGPGSYVVEKLLKALMCIKDVNRNKDMLIQIWIPVMNRGGTQILRTNGLPFSLESRSVNLAKYREISEVYQFSAEEDSKELVPGLPGRVYKEKVPEWTPDVRFFRSYEYPRVDHAQVYDVRGSLALPIFEQGSKNCLGVVEVVMTQQKINYRPELESVCQALEAVNLTSSKLPTIQNVKHTSCEKSYETALPEIQEVLRSACEIHKLPLAQTWIPCIKQGKEGCRHSEDNYPHCISPVEHACYVGDPSIQVFHEACSEHHLLKGQGVAGGAFMTNQPCFAPDITLLSKTDYPLSHHARMFGLRAAVAIRLRSIYNSSDDFVLEFFLPLECIDNDEQKKMLTSLSLIIQRVCHSLRVISDKELEEETDFSVEEVIAHEDSGTFASAAAWPEPLQSQIVASLGAQEKSSETMGTSFSDQRQQQQESSVLKGNLDSNGECSTYNVGNLSSKTGDKKKSKVDKTITLQVLRQHFAGSLKDAAKNIGVCTTTLKRICRQHGIKRWPSRKIKKVGHSLQKLQLVIDSVQGASGAFQIDSFYSKFPDLAASPNLSGTSLFSNLKQCDNNPNSLSIQPDPGSLSPEGASKSPSSSCSQSSISSHPCSSMAEQQNHHLTNNNFDSSKDQMVLLVGENSSGDGLLKRIRSEAELKSLNEDRVKIVMPRSQSQETLGQHNVQNGHHGSLSRTKSKGTQKEDAAYRVKVTYGDEKARFKMPKNWGYEDLVQEVGRRFCISDMSKFDVKYLDDDYEWVLLTCDDDLEECIEVCQSSESTTIKLCLQLSNTNHSMRNPLEFR